MPLAVGKTPSAWNSAEDGYMRTRRDANQLQERDDCANQHAAQQTGAEYAKGGCNRHNKFGAVIAPESFEGRELEQFHHGYQYHGGKYRLR